MFRFTKRFSLLQIYGMGLLALIIAIVPIALMVTPASAADNAAPPSSITFKLKPGPGVLNCVTLNHSQPPVATVKVTRGSLNDTMTITLSNIRKNTDFDVFTVQNSPLDSKGNKDANFKNFGMAWYQSDLHSDSNGNGSTTIKTILLDQIFGFDAATGLPPTNTFHVGFWFNNPKVPFNGGCETSLSPIITPFNGEHHAGILAMISTPNKTTGLGPLCTDPSSTPGACNP